MRGVATPIRAVHGNLDVVAGGFDNDGVVLAGAFTEMRLCFIQLPGAYVWIVGRANNGAEKKYDQGKQDHFYFHVLSSRVRQMIELLVGAILVLRDLGVNALHWRAVVW